MELLDNFPFVKVQPLANGNTALLQKTKENTKFGKNDTKKDFFAEVRGIWADRNIDGKTLRNQAWAIRHRTPDDERKTFSIYPRHQIISNQLKEF